MELTYDVVNEQFHEFCENLFSCVCVQCDFVNNRCRFFVKEGLLMKSRKSVLSGELFDDLCESSREFLNTSFDGLDLFEDFGILFDGRSEEEKRKATNAYMRELYRKFMEPNSTVEILYKGGPEQFCKDVETGIYDD